MEAITWDIKTIMKTDMYINNFVIIYYIFSLFNCERKAERYKELPRKPERCVLNSPIIIKLYEFGEDCSSVQIL